MVWVRDLTAIRQKRKWKSLDFASLAGGNQRQGRGEKIPEINRERQEGKGCDYTPSARIAHCIEPLQARLTALPAPS
jgi:hypothetical protein